MDTHRFPLIIQEIYAKVAELEAMFHGRRFTPDGNMVGGIGEAIAWYYYGVELHRVGHPEVDGTVNGRHIQIKATQIDRVGLKKGGDLLLVLKINKDGGFEEIYNGDALSVWDALAANKESYLREKSISLNKLRALQNAVNSSDRAKRLK